MRANNGEQYTGGESGIRTHGTVRVVDNPRTSKPVWRTAPVSHQNDLSGTQRMRSISNENTTKSTKSAFILPVITVWLQVERFPIDN
jgi:hypothetical protein